VQVAGSESIAIFGVTPNVTRHFCRACGSHVFTLDVRLPETMGVPAGIVEGGVSLEPRAHYFADHKAAWHTIATPEPQFGGASGVEPRIA
jgi:hypothetical protein